MFGTGLGWRTRGFEGLGGERGGVMEGAEGSARAGGGGEAVLGETPVGEVGAGAEGAVEGVGGTAAHLVGKV